MSNSTKSGVTFDALSDVMILLCCLQLCYWYQSFEDGLPESLLGELSPHEDDAPPPPKLPPPDLKLSLSELLFSDQPSLPSSKLLD